MIGTQYVVLMITNKNNNGNAIANVIETIGELSIYCDSLVYEMFFTENKTFKKIIVNLLHAVEVTFNSFNMGCEFEANGYNYRH